MNSKLLIAFVAFIAATLFISCEKEAEKACWQGWSPTGKQNVQGMAACDKTLAEMEADFPHFWFYKQNETAYCWRTVSAANDTTYWIYMPESIKDRYIREGIALNFTKLDCNSFCSLIWYQHAKSKITGLYKPTVTVKEVLGGSDTCASLYPGRTVIYRETADSIITRVVVNKQP
jgi:hypothetical protein